MAGKKNKQSNGANWDMVWKVLASVFAFAGSLATVYDLAGKIRSDTQTFYALILPGLVAIVWAVILVQLIRKKNPYVILLLAVTALGGVVGGIGWQSYNQTQEDKVIVLVAQFDGPEETYGLHAQIMEDLRSATKDYDDTFIIDSKEVVTSGQGNEYARELGKKANADIVIWAWYKPTENPNITIHFENLSTTQIETLSESETYQPQATLTELESFEIQRKLGSETSTLVSFIAGLLRFEKGDYSIALQRFKQILEEADISTYIDPKDLYFYMGSSNAYLGYFRESISNYDKVIELDPNSNSAYNNRGIVYDTLKQYERAIQDYDKAIALDSVDTSAYNNRGITYKHLKQYERAIQDYDKAIELNKLFSVAYYNRGSAYADLAQYERAIQDYDEATGLDPDYIDAYMNRGIAYDVLKQYERALVDYDKAIELDPNYAKSYSNRGITYAHLKQYQRAIKDFDRAIELSPNMAETYHNRGNIYSTLKQYERAIQDYDKGIELDPNFAPAYYNRGLAYYDLRDYGRALQDYGEAIELDSNYADAYANRGVTYFQLKAYVSAIQDFDKVIELSPNDTAAYLNRGVAYSYLQDYDHAIQNYDRVIELEPNNAFSYRNRGLAYQALGKTAEAEADFKKYEELTGGKP